jgi:hypothetical protein
MDRMTSGTTRGTYSSSLPQPAFAGAPGGARVGHGDRRHSFRVPVEGRASIWLRGRLHGHYALVDLSISGCTLRDGPECYPGEQVEVVLHLPDRPLFWLSAQVRRSAGEVGLCFQHPDPRSEDRLQDLVVEVYTRMHADSDSFSLVIDARSHVRRGLVHNLDAVGERAVAVATPLDAVQLLLERGERVLTAFIGPDHSDAATDHRSRAQGLASTELVEFLANNYPRVRRVLVGNAGEVSSAWIAEATGEVHGLLETPCSEETLRRLVHRISSIPHEDLS